MFEIEGRLAWRFECARLGNVTDPVGLGFEKEADLEDSGGGRVQTEIGKRRRDRGVRKLHIFEDDDLDPSPCPKRAFLPFRMQHGVEYCVKQSAAGEDQPFWTGQK